MRGSLVEVYLHYVWATWDRMPLITPDIEEDIYSAITGKCDEYHSPILAIGGIENHVHLLVRASPKLDIPSLARDAKGMSSHLIRSVVKPEAFFRWQGGYGAFSVDPRSIDRVAAYIRNQKEHHFMGTTNPYMEEYMTELSTSSHLG